MEKDRGDGDRKRTESEIREKMVGEDKGTKLKKIPHVGTKSYVLMKFTAKFLII